MAEMEMEFVRMVEGWSLGGIISWMEGLGCSWRLLVWGW